MSNHKKLNIIFSKFTILGLQLFASSIFLYAIYKVKFVPMRYIYITAVFLLGLLVLFAGMICWGEKKADFSRRSIISKTCSALISVILAIGVGYVIRGNSFIDTISDKSVDTHVVYVLVLENSKIESLSDIEEQLCGVSYQHDSQITAQAIVNFEKQTNGEINLEKYDSYIELADALYARDVEAIIIGSEYMGLLTDKYEHFEAQTKIIAQYSIKKELKQNVKTADVAKEAFTVYITGVDTYGEISTVSRSDVNLLVTVNPVTKTVLMISIPRDTQVTLASVGKKDKLTHTGIYGTQETIETIEGFLDVDINYYARTNFTGIEDIINQLGGVEVESPVAFTTQHGGYQITEGINRLDGEAALCFVRERYNLANGDFDRGKNQQRLLKAMLEKVMSAKIITNFSNILTAVEGTFETNMSAENIRALLNMQLEDMASWNYVNVQVTAVSSYKSKELYSVWGTESWVMVPDESSVEMIQAIIDKVIAGEEISEDELEGIGIDNDISEQPYNIDEEEE